MPDALYPIPRVCLSAGAAVEGGISFGQAIKEDYERDALGMSNGIELPSKFEYIKIRTLRKAILLEMFDALNLDKSFKASWLIDQLVTIKDKPRKQQVDYINLVLRWAAIQEHPTIQRIDNRWWKLL